MKKQVESICLEEVIHVEKYYTLQNGFDVRTNAPVTVRVIDKRSCASVKNLEAIVQEDVSIIRGHLNQSIAHIQEVIATQKNYYIVYEQCRLGLLEKELKQKTFFSEQTAVTLLEQIIDAYDALLKSSIVVRSFRLDSFLLCENDIIKLFDVGLIRNIEKYDEASPQPSTNLLLSLAPEIFVNKTADYRSDIWGIGLIFYQLLFGSMPWAGKTAQEYFRNVCNLPLNVNTSQQNISNEAVDFLKKTLAADPNKRADWNTLKNHKLFSMRNKSQFVKRQLELREELKTNPDSWQAQSMFFNSDPIVSRLDLPTSLRSSFGKRGSKSKQNSVTDSKASGNDKLQIIKEDDEMGESQNSSRFSHESSLKQQDSVFKRSQITDPESISLGASTIIGTIQKHDQPPASMLSSVMDFNRSNKQANHTNQHENYNKTPNMMQSAVVGGWQRENAKPQDLRHIFEQYKERILCHVDKYHIFSMTATSACKLFKTDLILIQCYFLYKKFCHLIEKLYDKLLSKENVLRAPHWEAFVESEIYSNILELVEFRHERGCEIFDKLLIDCRNQIKNGNLRLDAFDKYINEYHDDVAQPFDTIMYSYLTGVLENKEFSYDESSAYHITRHKVEVADCLLINKLPDIAEDDLLFDLSKHKAVLSQGSFINMHKYYEDKKSKLELLRFSNFSK